MKKSNKQKFVEKLIESFDIPFMDMDRCQICNGYDTIQTYIKKENGVWIHICEKCLKQILNEKGAS